MRITNETLLALQTMLAQAKSTSSFKFESDAQREIWDTAIQRQYGQHFAVEDGLARSTVGGNMISFLTLMHFDPVSGLHFYFAWTGAIGETVKVNIAGLGEDTQWEFLPNQEHLLSFAIPLPLTSAWFSMQCETWLNTYDFAADLLKG